MVSPRAGSAVQIPQSAPLDVRNAFQSLEGVFQKLFPTQPLRIPQYASDSLPAASQYPFSLIALTDLGMVAYSNGSDWVKTDGSAI